MMVWGRVNLHITDRKEESDRELVLLLALLDDIDSESCKTLLWWWLRPKFRVVDDDNIRGPGRAVITAWGTKAEANIDPLVDGNCKETRKHDSTDNSFRNQPVLDVPASIFRLEWWLYVQMPFELVDGWMVE